MRHYTFLIFISFLFQQTFWTQAKSAVSPLEDGVPKMTKAPFKNFVDTKDGTSYLITSALNEKMARFYPVSSSGILDESGMKTLLLPEVSGYILSVALSQDGASLFVQDTSGLAIYSSSSGDLVSRVDLAHNLVDYGIQEGTGIPETDQVLVQVNSDMMLYDLNEIGSPIGAYRLHRTSEERKFFGFVDSRYTSMAYRNDFRVYGLDRLGFELSTYSDKSGSQIYGLSETILHAYAQYGYTSQSKLFSYSIGVKAEFTNPALIIVDSEFTYQKTNLIEFDDHTAIATAGSRAYQETKLIYDGVDGFVNSDTTEEIKCHYQAAAQEGLDSDSMGYTAPAFEKSLTDLFVFNYGIIGISAKYWANAGYVSTIDQRFFDILNEPGSQVGQTKTSLLYFTASNKFAVSELNQVHFLYSDASSVIESFKFDRMVQSSWLGNSENTVFVSLPNSRFPESPFLIIQLNLETGDQKTVLEGDLFWDELTPWEGVYYSGEDSQMFVASDCFLFHPSNEAAVSRSLDTMRMLKKAYVERKMGRFIYPVEDEGSKSLVSFEYIFLIDASSEGILRASSEIPSTVPSWIEHFSSINAIFVLLSGDMSFYKIQAIDLISSLDSLDMEAIDGFSSQVERLVRTQIQTQAIGMSFDLRSVEVINFSSGAPVKEETAYSIQEDSFFADFYANLGQVQLFDAVYQRKTNFILTTSNIGFLKWDFDTIFNSQIKLYCESPCEECVTSPTDCIKCLPDSTLNQLQNGGGSCIEACSENEASESYDDGHSRCVSCVSPCKTCSGSGAHCESCIKSDSNNVLQTDGFCSDSCPKGQVLQEDSEGFNFCEDCQSPCAECSEEISFCTACLPSVSAKNLVEPGLCSDSCLSGHFGSPDSSTGYFSCLPCEAPCIECSGQASSCTVCDPDSKSSFVLYTVGKCSDSCDSGMFILEDISTSYKECTDCQSPCSECVTSSNNCLECEDRFLKCTGECAENEGQSPSKILCLETCPSGFAIKSGSCATGAELLDPLREGLSFLETSLEEVDQETTDLVISLLKGTLSMTFNETLVTELTEMVQSAIELLLISQESIEDFFYIIDQLLTKVQSGKNVNDLVDTIGWLQNSYSLLPILNETKVQLQGKALELSMLGLISYADTFSSFNFSSSSKNITVIFPASFGEEIRDKEGFDGASERITLCLLDFLPKESNSSVLNYGETFSTDAIEGITILSAKSDLIKIEILGSEGYTFDVGNLTNSVNISLKVSNVADSSKTLPLYFNESSSEWGNSGLSRCSFSENNSICSFSTSHFSSFRVFEAALDQTLILGMLPRTWKMITSPSKTYPPNTDLYSSAVLYIFLVIGCGLNILVLLVSTIDSKRYGGIFLSMKGANPQEKKGFGKHVKNFLKALVATHPFFCAFILENKTFSRPIILLLYLCRVFGIFLFGSLFFHENPEASPYHWVLKMFLVFLNCAFIIIFNFLIKLMVGTHQRKVKQLNSEAEEEIDMVEKFNSQGPKEEKKEELKVEQKRGSALLAGTCQTFGLVFMFAYVAFSFYTSMVVLAYFENKTRWAWFRHFFFVAMLDNLGVQVLKILGTLLAAKLASKMKESKGKRYVLRALDINILVIMSG